MAAPEIRTSDDLAKLFGQFPQIGNLIEQLGTNVDSINTLNQTAGGTDDDTAKQYLAKVKPAGQVLTDLVTLLKTVSAETGTSGEDATTLFNTAEDEAQTLAKDWSSSTS